MARKSSGKGERPRIVVLCVESAYSQRCGEMPWRVALMERNQVERCGRCNRGIVRPKWKAGEEPQYRDCAACGAVTKVNFLGQMSVSR